MDEIFIKGLKVRCVIGINENERREKQDVLIDITVFTDTRKAAESDKIEDAVDYERLKNRILEMVENSRFQLVETLAENIAGTCLDDSRIERVTVSVEKPGALTFAKSVGVVITRLKTV